MSGRGWVRRILRPGARGALVALFAALASATALAWTAGRALVVEPLSGVPAAVQPRILPQVTRGEGQGRGGVLAAVALDPFAPDRSPPAGRLSLAEGEPGEAAAAAHAGGGLRLVLLGTAVLPEGRSFALVQGGVAPSRMMRVGEAIGDLTLREVGQGRAVFTSPTGTRVEILLPKPGS